MIFAVYVSIILAYFFQNYLNISVIFENIVDRVIEDNLNLTRDAYFS